uniref:Uncharacterized protein n=1 Tax=Nelumbo nucifera TaxID=4432 RepID=A0A822YME2_NELNU|nr:TPA_asm: hypothetical protein HUJ06_011330 [Nelumbo nucifera]
MIVLRVSSPPKLKNISETSISIGGESHSLDLRRFPLQRLTPEVW